MSKKMSLLYRLFALTLVCLNWQPAAHAEIVALSTPNASGWTLENYSGNGGFIVIWGTGAV